MTKTVRRIVSVVAALAIAVLMAAPFGVAPSAPTAAADEPGESGTTNSGVIVTIDDKQPVNSTENGPTYDWYVFMWASVAENTATESGSSEEGATKVTYYVTSQERATALSKLKVGEDTIFKTTQVNTENHWNVELNKKPSGENFTAQEIAAALNSLVEDKTTEELGKVTEQHGSISANPNEDKQFTIRDNGYVLVNSSLGTSVILDTFQSKRIEEKNLYPTNEKYIRVANSDVQETSAEIGQEVTFTIPISIPATANKEIIVTDIISKGLSMNTAVTASVPPGTLGDGKTITTQYTWTDKTSSPAPADGSKTYQLTIPKNEVETLAGHATITETSDGKRQSAPTVLTLNYTATVNAEAKTESPWETNKAHIKYDNYTTPDKSVTVKTFQFQLTKKINSAAGDILPGVKFTLTRTDGSGDSAKTYYYTSGSAGTASRFAELGPSETIESKKLETNTSGLITFSGLAEGTYRLTETDTIAGYTGLTSPIDIQVDKDGGISANGVSNDIAVFQTEADSPTVSHMIIVINKSGSMMPSTGGPGTAVLYAVGGVLVVAAGVALVARRRMRKQ